MGVQGTGAGCLAQGRAAVGGGQHLQQAAGQGVRVRGQDLQLLVMTEQELRITGKISGIELVE